MTRHPISVRLALIGAAFVVVPVALAIPGSPRYQLNAPTTSRG
jgi:hypothetical protein